MEHETNKETVTPKSTNKKELQSISSAIMFSGVLIAVSIFFSGGLTSKGDVSAIKSNKTTNTLSESIISEEGKMKEVSEKDHIRGSLGARLILVEFSDPECPFCKEFHKTLKKVIADYSPDNKLAWVYRHFPIDGLHKNARLESQAIECAAILGGNDFFWKYLDELFVRTSSNDGLNISELPRIASSIGLDTDKFNQCLSGDEAKNAVALNVADGLNAGVKGTPHSILLNTKTGEKISIPGMVSEDVLRNIIEKSLK